MGRWFCLRLLGWAQEVPGTWGSGGERGSGQDLEVWGRVWGPGAAEAGGGAEATAAQNSDVFRVQDTARNVGVVWGEAKT